MMEIISFAMEFGWILKVTNLVQVVYFTRDFVYISYDLCRWNDTTGHLCWSTYHAQKYIDQF